MVLVKLDVSFRRIHLIFTLHKTQLQNPGSVHHSQGQSSACILGSLLPLRTIRWDFHTLIPAHRQVQGLPASTVATWNILSLLYSNFCSTSPPIILEACTHQGPLTLPTSLEACCYSGPPALPVIPETRCIQGQPGLPTPGTRDGWSPP